MRPSAGTSLDLAGVVLPRGARLRVLEPGDAPALEALNGRLSPRSRWLRYFTTGPQPGHWYVDRLMHQEDPRDTVVAVVDDEIVAVAGFSPYESDPTKAELAVLVDDAHQHTGLGTLLLARLATIAAQQGVLTFVAVVLLENRAMHRLLTDTGFLVRVTAGSRGEHELEITLPRDLRPEL